jgi:hypothetical protein
LGWVDPAELNGADEEEAGDGEAEEERA